jgi:hypothetical protein
VPSMKSTQEFVLKVWIKGQKRISRTLAFSGDQTLDDVHEAIFDAFDRYDEHLYSFYFPRRRPKDTRPPTIVTEYVHPYVLDEEPPFAMFGGFTRRPPIDASLARLDALELRVGQIFEYLFDFGDDWLHEIEVRQIAEAPSDREYPALLETKGKSPPQYPGDEEE